MVKIVCMWWLIILKIISNEDNQRKRMKNLLRPRPFQLESKLHDFYDEEINDISTWL